MNDCLFCKIISGEIASEKIYEDEKTFAFLDIRPASQKGGHVLVMPKKHYELVSEMSDGDCAAVMKTIKRLSKALLEFGEGMNIVQNNRRVAGQYVKHVHFHLIPRFEGDGIVIEKWKTNAYKEEDIKKVANAIKKLL